MKIVLFPISATLIGILSHQPIAVGTISKTVKAAMKYAHHVETLTGRVVPDLVPGALPKWGTHSARRGGAKRAMETRHLSGVSPLHIDFHFGWDEMAHAREHTMMWMYAGDAKREERRMVTAFF